MAQDEKTKWHLIDIATNEVVCKGKDPYDLLAWYTQNHTNSWYGYGRTQYNMVNVGKKEDKTYYL